MTNAYPTLCYDTFIELYNNGDIKSFTLEDGGHFSRSINIIAFEHINEYSRTRSLIGRFENSFGVDQGRKRYCAMTDTCPKALEISLLTPHITLADYAYMALASNPSPNASPRVFVTLSAGSGPEFHRYVAYDAARLDAIVQAAKNTSIAGATPKSDKPATLTA